MFLLRASVLLAGPAALLFPVSALPVAPQQFPTIERRQPTYSVVNVDSGATATVTAAETTTVTDIVATATVDVTRTAISVVQPTSDISSVVTVTVSIPISSTASSRTTVVTTTAAAATTTTTAPPLPTTTSSSSSFHSVSSTQSSRVWSSTTLPSSSAVPIPASTPTSSAVVIPTHASSSSSPIKPVSSSMKIIPTGFPFSRSSESGPVGWNALKRDQEEQARNVVVRRSLLRSPPVLMGSEEKE